MNKPILATAIALLVATSASVQAKDKHHDKHHDSHHDHYYSSGHRSRTVYVIENRRPVERVVYIDDDGRYYRRYDSRRVYVNHYYTSYPSRYYYPSGRPRIGVSIHF